MANEVKFYLGITGHTLRFTARQPDGTLRGSANQTLPEVSTTGYYTQTPDVALQAGDMVSVEDQTASAFYQGEYRTDVTDPIMEAKVDILDTNVDALILASGKVLITNQEPESEQTTEIVVLKNL